MFSCCSRATQFLLCLYWANRQKRQQTKTTTGRTTTWAKITDSSPAIS